MRTNNDQKKEWSWMQRKSRKLVLAAKRHPAIASIAGFIVLLICVTFLYLVTSFSSNSPPRREPTQWPLLATNENAMSPPNMEPMMVQYATKTALSSPASAEWHMLNVRNAQPFGGMGSIFDFPTQWQAFFWRVQRHTLDKDSPTICEIGLGPGYSAIMLLVATTEGKWNEGATLVEFDLGLEADQGDGYGPRKKIAHKYIQKVFEKRARFIFGNSDKTLPAFQKEGKKCDVIHIDGSHNKEGVITDLKNAKEIASKNALVLLDDYDWPGVKEAIDSDENIRLESVVEVTNNVPADWMATSVWKKEPEIMTKKFVIAYFK